MPTKILAIDDSKTMRLAIKITFAAEDADVTSVSKGSEAVARARQMGADVVLVDAALAAGEPSGYEVCRALKQDPNTANIPVVILVSGQTGVDQAKLAEVGGDDWLAKPFDTQELIDKVAAVQGKAVAKPTAAAPPPRAAAVAAEPEAEPAAAQSGTSKRLRPQNRTQMGMPSPTPTPAPVAAPPPGRATAAAAKPAATPKPASATRGGATGKPAMATPAPRQAAAAPARASAGMAAGSGGVIPIAIPIPFTAADSPTPGMVARLQEAAGAAGVDPSVAEAIAALSREVIERIVWEVVPDLAESIIREHQAQSA